MLHLPANALNQAANRGRACGTTIRHHTSREPSHASPLPVSACREFLFAPARVLTILLSAIAALAALNLTAGTARALEAIWQGTFSEFWTNDFNWFGASPPVPADKASFDESAVVAVLRPAIILDANRTVLEFVVRGNHAIAGAVFVHQLQQRRADGYRTDDFRIQRLVNVDDDP